MKARARAALPELFPPLFLFALNVWICWRLFRTEYLAQMPSIEGSFISLAGYIERHWPFYDWFPMWYAGMPFMRVYPPGLHYAVAIVGKTLSWSPATAYHVVTGIAYSLGAVTFYCLARALGGSRTAAFGGALVFSLFSPSSLLIKVLRVDAGGLLNPRRLRVLVVYGEGPNVTGLMLAMLALALLHRALRIRTPLSALLAAVALASVPIVNWTATIGLLMGLTAYFLAGKWRETVAGLPRLLLIGTVTAALAFPFELPSTIRSTFFDAVSMDEGLSRGVTRLVAFALLAATLALLRTAMIRWGAPFGLRFAVLYSVLTAWIVLGAMWWGVRLVPLPERFHIAMEIPIVLAATFAAASMCEKWPRLRYPLAAMLIVFCVVQTVQVRRYARLIIRGIDIKQTVEYQEADWLNQHISGGPAMLPGSTAFWANIFTEIPQANGCCEQSLSTHVPLIGRYVIFAGHEDDAQSADYSLLWLKAFAVQAVALGGPRSREFYKDFRYPYRFQGRLPLLWRDGDDYIYRVPERAPGLARVVPAASLVRQSPWNGIDVGELRPFVRALDDAALPIANFAWSDLNTARVTGDLAAGQVLSIAVTWDRGWSATANGQTVPVRPDGLGLIAIDPRCAGPCDVRLHWSAGAEPVIVIAIAVLTLIGMGVWALKQSAGRRPTPHGMQPTDCSAVE